MENKTNAIVDWYDEKKGFGIAKNGNEENLLILKMYLKNSETLFHNDNIVCDVIQKGKVKHATNICKIKSLNDSDNYIKEKKI